MLLLRKILCGILSAVSLLGSLVLTCMGLLAPLCPDTEELASKVDDDCAAFIEITCFFSILLLGISLAGLKFGKFDIFQKIITKVVYLVWFIMTLARLIYAASSVSCG